MVAKNTTLAAAVVLGFSQGAKAEKIKDTQYETLKVSCDPFFLNSSSECQFNSVQSESELIAQRRGRRRKSKVQGYYAGFGLGVGFPSGEVDAGEGDVEGIDFDNPEYTTAFIGNLFGGIRLTKNIAADLEFLVALGGVDSDSFEDSFNELASSAGIEGSLETDGDFSSVAIYINPRFELPLSQTGKFNIYISPGIGLSQTNVNFESSGDFSDPSNTLDLSELNSAANFDEDASNTGVTFQIKGGASLLFTDTLGAFAQARFSTLPTDDGFDSINIFGIDAGLKFNF